MILAAGRGERLRPATLSTPKPLLPVKGKPMIEAQLEKLAASGFRHIVINISYLADNIVEYLGDGRQYGVRISYSREPGGPYGTGGGIVNALELLHEEEFLVVNSDVYSDIDFGRIRIGGRFSARLILVDNPAHNPRGDFGVADGILIGPGAAASTFTFSGVGRYRRGLFEDRPSGFMALTDILQEEIEKQMIAAEVHPGFWMDLGTKERLDRANSFPD